jgi:S-sulfo-L-cysteine synthase (3-phospho-L-serine-dependent)
VEEPVTGWLVFVESNTTGTGRLFCRAALRAGLRPVLLARDPGRYPWAAADDVPAKRVDTDDPAALLAACRGLPGPVRGVTSSSEYRVAAAAEAARALGLAHPDPDAVRTTRDKAAMRAALAAAGLPGPWSAVATTPDEAAAAPGFPVVVKPVSGSGSIGVVRCDTPEQARAAAAAVLAGLPGLPAQPAVLVEDYLPGPEFSVETFDDRVVGVTAKHLGPEPHFVETGHDFPAPVPAAVRTALAGAAVTALRALGLGWGAAHVELRLTTAGPRVVEVNPRLAGGMIPRLVEEATGLDLVARQVARAAGRTGPLRPTRAAGAAIRFLVGTSEGRLVDVRGADRARAVPGVVEVGVLARPGQEVTLRHSFQDRLAYVVAAGPGPAAAAQAAEQGLRHVTAAVASPAAPARWGA